MKVYEGVFIFPPEGTPETHKSQDTLVEEGLKKFQATVVQKAEWGKKPLGYLVQKHKEGYVFVFDFQMEPSKLKEFRKTLELQEGLLKFMITVKPKKVRTILDAKPAAATPAAPAAHAHS